MRIGILGLQGSVKEHLDFLCRIAGNGSASLVKKASDVEGLDGLVIPGGESTTIGRLMRFTGVDKAIRKNKKLAIMGTCAGAIMLAKNIEDSDQFSLGLMDITVERNAYGRQKESFETTLEIPALGKKLFKAVFIRAPAIEKVGRGVKVLAKHGDEPVMVRQGRYLALTFHPELTDDQRIHRYFLEMLKE